LPKLVFVLDISGSTQISVNEKYTGKLNNMRENIARQFRQMSIRKNLSDFLKYKNDGKYNELMVNKLKLLEIIIENYENYEINIICFGTETYSTTKASDYRKLDMEKAMSFIMEKEADKESVNKEKAKKKEKGDLTDFNELFNFIHANFSTKSKPKKASEIPLYTFLFFSDYLHDIGTVDSEEKEKIRETLDEKIKEFYNAYQHFSDFFYFETDIERKTNSDNTIDLFSILKKNLDVRSKGHIVATLEYNEKIEFLNTLSKTYIPIYYTHSYPKSDLSTQITFNKIRKKDSLIFSIEGNRQKTDDYHHQFYLAHIDSKDTSYIFSPTPNPVVIGEDYSLVLAFSGRVIDPFSCTTFTVYDKSKHAYIRFDIVFFKDFPWFVRWIIMITMCFAFFTIFVFIGRNKDY
jgi:hypothetical protein